MFKLNAISVSCETNSRTVGYLKRTLFIATLAALAAPATMAQVERPATNAAKTIRLTESQMDGIAAGSITAEAEAWAAAVGYPVYTNAYAVTSAYADGRIERGQAGASAYACCGDTTAYASAQASGTGGIVISHSTQEGLSTPVYSSASGYATVIAIDVNVPNDTNEP